MHQNGQMLQDANAATFLKCVWPFWDIMHWKVKIDNVKNPMWQILILIKLLKDSHMDIFRDIQNIF